MKFISFRVLTSISKRMEIMHAIRRQKINQYLKLIKQDQNLGSTINWKES